MISLPVFKYNLWFRFVEERDAEFILSLRTDPVLSRYLSPTDGNLDNQRAWIKKYKEREASGQEYYVIFEDETYDPQGVMRLYDFKNNTHNRGSWLVKPGADELTAIKSDIFITNFARQLQLGICKFDVRKANKKVLRFHTRFSEIIAEDELNYYFQNTEEAELKKLKFLERFLE